MSKTKRENKIGETQKRRNIEKFGTFSDCEEYKKIII